MYKKNIKKAFTLAEALLTMVILGIIAAFTITQIRPDNYGQQSMQALAKKMVANLIQATTQILINNATVDDFLSLKNKDDYFSITDPNVAPKMAKLFQIYLPKVQTVPTSSDPYFSQKILDYKRVPTTVKVNDYSGFFTANDGVLLGFRFYQTCTKTEDLSIEPGAIEIIPVANICGSVFFDVNGLKKPNKLGSDQYVIPIGKRGITFDE